MTTSGAELVFGSLPLLSPGFGDADYQIEALGDGADFGNPAAVIASVASMLMDGDKARINRFGNREVTIPIQIRGANLDIVSDGEAAVMLEVNKGRNILTWTPPGTSTPSVYDVVYSTLTATFLDLDETRVTRRFTLKLECAPFPRPEEPTVVVATPIPSAPPTWVTIDACTSLSGWVSGSTLSLADGGTAVQATKTELIGVIEMQRNGLSVPAGGYLVVNWEMRDSFLIAQSVVFKINGVVVKPRAIESVGLDRQRWFVPIPDVGVNRFSLAQYDISLYSGKMLMHDVSTVDQLPFSGSRRQRYFTAPVGGTARTQADLVAEGEGGADIGDELLIYTAPAGEAMQPSLSKWLSASGTSTPDATSISGLRTSFGAMAEFSFPVPRPGAHLLVGRLRGPTGTATVNWGFSNATSNYAAPTDIQTGSAVVSWTPAWRMYQLGVVTLPTTATSEDTPVLQYASISTTPAEWDEFWLFNLDVGTLSWFSGLHASPSAPSRAVIRSASLASPRPTWMVGDAGSPELDVDVSRRMVSPGVHEFRPGLMDIFTASTGAPLSVTVEAYDRFMHNVTAEAS